MNDMNGEIKADLWIVVRCSTAHENDKRPPTGNKAWDDFSERVKANRKVCKCFVCGEDCYCSQQINPKGRVPQMCSECLAEYSDREEELDRLVQDYRDAN